LQALISIRLWGDKCWCEIALMIVDASDGCNDFNAFDNITNDDDDADDDECNGNDDDGDDVEDNESEDDDDNEILADDTSRDE